LAPVERHPTPHRIAGRGGEKPLAVVVHTADGSFHGTLAWFADPASGVSAHYLIGLDGRLAQFVDEEDTARHAGNVLRPTARLAERLGSDPNPLTIGIEFEDGGDPLGVERPDAQYARGATLIAELAARWGIPLDRDHVIGHRELFADKECPGNLDVERLLAQARQPRAGDITCLLPVRNGAADLPGWLESVSRFASAVIALDDGSDDETAAMLSASPLVRRAISNPRRGDHRGWDDAANRQRLLDEAIAAAAPWVMFLDADERVDADDAEALREFAAGDALPGCAYGFELYRAWGERVTPRPLRVHRLFAPRPGQTLPTRRLDFTPVPTQIQSAAWIETTIRIRHLDSPERLAARHRKYDEADPGGGLASGPARMLTAPEGTLVAWRPRPPGLPVLAVDADPALTRVAPQAPVTSNRPLLACLLPVRDAAADLPGWLEAAEPLADLVIALDDGSNDETAAILERSTLVERLLRNPRRDGYRGWDDAGNRARLLEAAREAGVRWALFLDADERIDELDAAALRRFLESGADPERAYGMRVFRMIGDEHRYDRAELWAYRLFSPDAPGSLPGAKLHLVPVPDSIPRANWVKTTVRIKHLAGLSAERRRARFAKYEQADPERVWQSDYGRLLDDPGPLREWAQRPAGLPVLATPAGSPTELDLEALDPGAPLLSAIVISRDDEALIERAVGSVVSQECPFEFEVIVAVSGSDRTAEVVRERYPQLRVVEVPEPGLPGAARNAGLAVARGEYVSFPGSHVELPPGSLAARARAHEAGWAMVTGSVRNGTGTRAGWAAYFLDHPDALPDRPSSELDGPPAHCSYVREFLLEAGGFPEDMRAGEDTVVNRALWERGHRAWRERDLWLTHHTPCRTVPRLVSHHFQRGRGLGRILRGDAPPGRSGRRGLAGFLAGYPRARLHQVDRRIERWGGELGGRYRRVRPLVMLAIAAAWAGASIEALGRRRPPPDAIGGGSGIGGTAA
jgi:glycosyltransferase involved in cell wall biosynthesis